MNNKNNTHSVPTVNRIFVAVLLATSSSAFSAPLDYTAKQRLSYAKSELQKGNLQTAKGILLDLLQAKPELLRAKAELAMTYYRLQDWSNANQMADELLDSNNLPKAVKLNIAKLKNKITQNMRNQPTSNKHKLFGFIQVAVGNDSNLGLTAINDAFSDNQFDPNIVNETELFGGQDPSFIYEPDYYHGTEPYQTHYLEFAETCMDPEATTQTSCSQLEQLVADSGLQATLYLADGFLDQDGNFIPYSELLPYTDGTTDITAPPVSYNFNDAFWRANAKVTHQYFDKDSKYQWSNTIHMTSETAFELTNFDKNRVRYDSRILKSLSNNWLISGQIYYSRMNQSSGPIHSYKGLRPEISYFSPLGKFALRFDWLSKHYEIDDFYTEKSHYHSQTLSWSNYFKDKTLLISSRVRFAKNSSPQLANDYHSKSLSVSGLYAINNDWEFHLSATSTHFDFLYKPSADVNKLATTLSYRFSSQWKSFVTIEYNKVGHSYYPEDINRTAYQIGLSRYF